MLSASKDSDSAADAPPDARRELLERVLSSPVFARSERLSSLLSFICEMTLQGREKELNEQRIGEAVFGRSRDYDSSIDGIVRTQASRLRNRLDLYFNGDGAKEPVRIVIPRGGYIPRFEPLAFAQTESLATLHDGVRALGVVSMQPDRGTSDDPPAALLPALIAPPPVRWFARAAVPWVLVALMSVAGLVFAITNPGAISRVKPHPASHPMWSRMFGENQRTLIVCGDSGLVMWQGLMGRNVHLAEYLSREYLTQPPTAFGTANPKVASDIGTRRYTSIVDLDVVQSLLQISQSQKGTEEIRYARDVRPNDLKQGNVILIGTAEATPWVELFEPTMNFYFFDDREKKVFSVFNRAPQGTEPRQWDSAYGDAKHRVYAVVAYLPNLSGQGNALILEGTSMAGTESAWDFVADDSQLFPFLNRIRKPDGSLPHFEVVLGTNNVNGSAGKNMILAWRTTR